VGRHQRHAAIPALGGGDDGGSLLSKFYSILEPQMDADERRLELDSITERIIGAAYQVSNTLGVGFLEKVYENALAFELRKSGMSVVQQQIINVRYEEIIVGQYVADMVVEDSVIIEMKAVKCLDDIHRAQCLNYLKATGMTVCLLINFATPKIDVNRIVNKF
jgi:GxxExxY protein